MPGNPVGRPTGCFVEKNIETKKSCSPSRDIVFLLFLALAYRVAFLLAMPRVLDTADAIHYLESARHFAEGDFFGIDPKIPVLYPLLTALAHLFFRDLEQAGMAVSFAASVFTIAPLYGLARMMHGRAAAVVAGLTAAIWPWLADYACRVGNEALGTFWWFLAVWLLVRALRRGGIWLWLAPWPFLALHLTRPEGTSAMVAALVAGLVLCGVRDRAARKRLFVFAAVCGLLLVLNMFYVRALTGAATANYRVGFILQEFDFTRFAQTASKTLSDVLPVMLGPVLLLFMGLGLFAPRPEGRDVRLECCVLLFAAAQWAASLFVLSPAPRYLMVCIIALSTWSAYGMVFASRQAAGLRHGRVLRLVPVAALVAVMLLHTAVTVGSEHVGRQPREPREYKQAGLWMKEQLSPGLIFCRKPQIGYYAGMPSTGPGLADTLDQALARARQAGVRYVVIDERYTAQDVPGLRPLIDPAQAPAGLRCLKQFDTYPKSRVVVYELLGS